MRMKLKWRRDERETCFLEGNSTLYNSYICVLIDDLVSLCDVSTQDEKK